MAIVNRVITAIQFLDGALIIDFMTPSEDAKKTGVTVSHSVLVPFDNDYCDEIDLLVGSALGLLEDVLEDLPNLEPVDLIEDEEEEDEEDEDDEGDKEEG